MGYVLELFLDEGSDAAVRGLWDEFERLKIATSPASHGARPHISIGSCQQIEVAEFNQSLHDLAAVTLALPVQFSSVSTFLSAEGVVFLAPEVTVELLQLHAVLIGIMQECDAVIPAYYYPGVWTPHCTLATNLSPEKLSCAVVYCQQHVALIKGFVTEISLVEIGVGNVGGAYSVALRKEC